MSAPSQCASAVVGRDPHEGGAAGAGPDHLVELGIDSLAYGGAGLGRLADGRVVFVPYTAPGDRVAVALTREHRRHAEARVEKWLERASCRAEPFCPHFTRCGGCHLQHLEQAAQLDWKRTFVRDALSRLGGVGDPQVSVIPPPQSERGYRCHAELAVELKSDAPRIGFRAATSEEVVDLESCPLLTPLVNSLLGSARAWLREHADTLGGERGQPWLRWLDIRANADGEESTVVLWCHSIPREQTASLTAHLRQAEPTLRGVRAVRCRGKTRTPGGKSFDLLGPGHLLERVGDRRLRVSTLSFYQANPVEAQRLIEAAWQLAGSPEPENVVELYAGVGLFTASLAARAQHVVAVESSPSAARDLTRNTHQKGPRRVAVRQGDAAVELRKLLAAGQPGPDQMWVNPPRGGMDKGVVEAMGEASPDSLVYVSCDPTTLSRDVRRLAEKGYELIEARPFDLFPHTFHVETVAFLRRPAA